jgi:hypothetical protein
VCIDRYFAICGIFVYAEGNSKSYCLLTSGGAPIEMIQKYIKSQGNAKSF